MAPYTEQSKDVFYEKMVQDGQGGIIMLSGILF